MSDDSKILMPWLFLFGFSFSFMWLLEGKDIDQRLQIFMTMGLVWAMIAFPTVIFLTREYELDWRFWKGTQYQAKAIVVPLTVGVCGILLAFGSLIALIF